MARRYSRGRSGVEEPVMAKKVGDWLLLPSRVGIEVAQRCSADQQLAWWEVRASTKEVQISAKNILWLKNYK